MHSNRMKFKILFFSMVHCEKEVLGKKRSNLEERLTLVYIYTGIPLLCCTWTYSQEKNLLPGGQLDLVNCTGFLKAKGC